MADYYRITGAWVSASLCCIPGILMSVPIKVIINPDIIIIFGVIDVFEVPANIPCSSLFFLIIPTIINITYDIADNKVEDKAYCAEFAALDDEAEDGAFSCFSITFCAA